jgi:predicted PurR-regulated permease PerM
MAATNWDASAAHLKQLRTAFIIICVLAIVAVVYVARDFLIPVVLAFFIALTFRPSVRRLARFNVPPWAAATVFVTLLVLIALSAAWLASGPISDWIANAPEIERTFMEKIRALRSSLAGVIKVTENIQEAATPPSDPGVQEVVVKDSYLPELLTLIVGYPANFIFLLSGAVVIAAFLMASGDLFYEKLLRVLPTLTDKKTALRIIYDVEREVSAYLLSLTAVNLGVAIAVGVTFHFLGMPTPYLWALLAFVLNFIPYLGPIAGTVLSAFAAIVVYDNLGEALLPPLAYMVFIGIETQIVSPLLLSRRLQLNSVAILLALAFWAWAWGIPGIVLAVPLLVTFRVFCSHLAALAPYGEFLGESEPADTDEQAEAAMQKKT